MRTRASLPRIFSLKLDETQRRAMTFGTVVGAGGAAYTYSQFIHRRCNAIERCMRLRQSAGLVHDAFRLVIDFALLDAQLSSCQWSLCCTVYSDATPYFSVEVRFDRQWRGESVLDINRSARTATVVVGRTAAALTYVWALLASLPPLSVRVQPHTLTILEVLEDCATTRKGANGARVNKCDVRRALRTRHYPSRQ